VWGDLTGVQGDLTMLVGNVDECEITEEERKAGVGVETLVDSL